MTDSPRFSGTLERAERDEFVPFVAELAAVASAVVRRHFLADVAVELKGDDSPVTVADRRAEEVLRTLIGQRYPDHGILGEEFGATNPGARYRWVLDPVDGTKAFIANCFVFGTLIALLRDGRPILGVIAHPATGLTLVGEGGGPTRLGERPVRVRPVARIEEATLLTTDHWQMRARPEGAAFEALARRARLYRTWGDCHGYFQVATGGAQLMIDPELEPWDILALVPVIEGAGGRITAIDGGSPLEAGDLLASAGGALHDAVLHELAGRG